MDCDAVLMSGPSSVSRVTYHNEISLASLKVVNGNDQDICLLVMGMLALS